MNRFFLQPPLSRPSLFHKRRQNAWHAAADGARLPHSGQIIQSSGARCPALSARFGQHDFHLRLRPRIGCLLFLFRFGHGKNPSRARRQILPRQHMRRDPGSACLISENVQSMFRKNRDNGNAPKFTFVQRKIMLQCRNKDNPWLLSAFKSNTE